MRLGVIPLSLVLAAFVVTGCSSSNSGSSASSSKSDEPTSAPVSEVEETSTPAAPPEKKNIIFSVDSPADSSQIEGHAVTLRGTVQPATAVVKIAGSEATTGRSGRWHARVRLHHLGENYIALRALVDGTEFEPYKDAITIIRRRTAHERAALRAARIRHAQEAEQAFRSSAQAIDYDQLIKNPERYSGAKVTYSGKIMQISERDFPHWMLLETSCDEYDFCDDLMYVTYTDPIDSAEDDHITIFGRVKGGYEYDTTGGGTNFVPKVRAKFIDE